MTVGYRLASRPPGERKLRRHARNDRGFALIVVMGLMVLVMVLAVGLWLIVTSPATRETG